MIKHSVKHSKTIMKIIYLISKPICAAEDTLFIEFMYYVIEYETALTLKIDREL